jgi:hypothetical protein
VNFSGDLAQLAQSKIFPSWLRPLFRKDWIVYSKPPFAGPEHVLQYLGRYTHLVAICNHRLVSSADGQVRLCSAHPAKALALLLCEKGRLPEGDEVVALL